MKPMDDAKPFELSRDALCLDFANTWGARPDPACDMLHGYPDLVRFARQADLLGDTEAKGLLRAAADDPGRADRVFAEAVALREAMYRAFSALARGDAVAADDIDRLNHALARALPHLRIRPGGACCRWEWSLPPGALDRMLWPIARSAADLLTGDEVGHLGECDSPTCSWLFLDRSRNHRRRWCDMATCGNRAKARRYYQRHQ